LECSALPSESQSCTVQAEPKLWIDDCNFHACVLEHEVASANGTLSEWKALKMFQAKMSISVSVSLIHPD